MTPELVTIGRIVKPHGIHGEVAVDVLSDVPGRFDAGTEVHVGGRAATIASSRPHQGRMLLRFDHVTDRTSAELLRGRELTAPPVDLGDSDTFYVHELVGLPVRDDGDRLLGTVDALIELPSAAGYDLLEVAREDGTTWLLPAVDDLVEVEEDGAGSLLLRVRDLPDGLLDPTDAEVVRPDAGIGPGDEHSDGSPR